MGLQLEGGINWTDASWSPWWGCQRVSPGCVHCYAESLSKRYGHDIWGPEAPRRLLSEDHWRKPLVWDRKAREAGRIMRVSPSMCDPLEDRRDLDVARSQFFQLVDHTPNLMWLILTKRPENWRMFPRSWQRQWPSNAMFGFTAESGEYLQKRWIHWDDFATTTLGLATFISAEPLLAPLNFNNDFAFVHQIICGGESGAGARPMHPDWARSLRDQCAAAGVPFLCKQWGEWLPISTPRLKAKVEGANRTVIMDSSEAIPRPASWSDVMASTGNLWAREKVGKKAAGRLLDGVEHNGLPCYWPSNVGMIQQPNPLEVLA